MQFDYKALNEPVADEMVKKYAADHVSGNSLKTVAVVSVAIWLFLTVPLVVAGLSGGKNLDKSIIIIVVIITMIAALSTAVTVGAVVWRTKSVAKEITKLRRFAEANGAVYSYGDSPHGLHGLIFDKGHAGTIEHSLAFSNGIEIGNYKYTTGTGDNQAKHSYGFARVALNKELPNMVLDAKSNNFLGTNLPDKFQSSQRLKLGGDFDKYFNLYVPDRYQHDALSIFTSEVMQALVTHGGNFDIEVVGNELYIYSKKKIGMSSQTQLEGWIEIVESISGGLKDQSNRYVDERASGQIQLDNGAAHQAKSAIEGVRLKKGSNFLGLSIFFGLMIIVILPILVLAGIIADSSMLIAWIVYIIVGAVGIGIFIAK